MSCENVFKWEDTPRKSLVKCMQCTPKLMYITFEVIHILFPGSHFFGNGWLSTENSFYYFDYT